MKQKDQNNSDPALIFPCSGASDAGELAVRIARRMMRSGSGKMFCLAAIGGHIQQFIEDAQLVENIIIYIKIGWLMFYFVTFYLAIYQETQLKPLEISATEIHWVP